MDPITVGLLCLAVFLSAAAGDIVEAYMVRAVVDLNPTKTAAMSVSMWAIGCVGWIIIVKTDPWYIYLAPEVLGLCCGSLIGVSLQRKAKEREAPKTFPRARARYRRARTRARAYAHAPVTVGEKPICNDVLN
jgi:hypothetical protein